MAAIWNKIQLSNFFFHSTFSPSLRRKMVEKWVSWDDLWEHLRLYFGGKLFPQRIITDLISSSGIFSALYIGKGFFFFSCATMEKTLKFSGILNIFMLSFINLVFLDLDSKKWIYFEKLVIVATFFHLKVCT